MIRPEQAPAHVQLGDARRFLGKYNGMHQFHLGPISLLEGFILLCDAITDRSRLRSQIITRSRLRWISTYMHIGS